MKNRLNSAHDFVLKKHANQKRRFTGEPYVKHLEETAQLLWEVAPNSAEDDFIAAVLHDTVEDTDTNIDEIGQLFGCYVMKIVAELTSNSTEKDRLGANIYMATKINSMSNNAFNIKLCDRLSNVVDLKHPVIPNAFVKYYWNNTNYILSNIDRELDDTQKQLIDRISSMLIYLRMTRNISLYDMDISVNSK